MQNNVMLCANECLAMAAVWQSTLIEVSAHALCPSLWGRMQRRHDNSFGATCSISPCHSATESVRSYYHECAPWSCFKHASLFDAKGLEYNSWRPERGEGYSVSFDFPSFDFHLSYVHVRAGILFSPRATHASRLFKELQRRAARLGCRC